MLIRDIINASTGQPKIEITIRNVCMRSLKQRKVPKLSTKNLPVLMPSENSVLNKLTMTERILLSPIIPTMMPWR